MSRAERVDAAARSFWGIEPGHQLSAARNTRMGIALTASDTLLRTDEAVERVARAIAGDVIAELEGAPPVVIEAVMRPYQKQATAAIAALLGEGE